MLGGAWNEPVYAFVDADAQTPFDRSATFGFRCVRYIGDAPLPDAVTATIQMPSRDYSTLTPVSDEVFRAYARFYAYSKEDLKSHVEQVDDSSAEWRREKITFDAAYNNERMSAQLYLPKGFTAPYQTVVYFPGSGPLTQRSIETDLRERPPFDYILKSGRAVVLPVYKSTYDRGDGMETDVPDVSTRWRDHVVAWSKDLGRTIDYLETRTDIAKDKIAFCGQSWGAQEGTILPAVEPRIKVVILVLGGFPLQESLPEVEALNFSPRITQPTLMLNGRYDFFFPTESTQEPMYRFIGAAPEHKRRVVYETGHNIPRPELIKETLGWLDKDFGTVSRSGQGGHDQ